jgi:hypothetical protein
LALTSCCTAKTREADRIFLRDILGLHSVDAGHGWLIFTLPPAEAAFHPLLEMAALANAEC